MLGKCETCCWWIPYGGGVRAGVCRARPPTAIPNPKTSANDYGLWPQTQGNDYCGIWRQNPRQENERSAR